jgi:hypothetical protein
MSTIERGTVNGWECDNCRRVMYAVHCSPGVTPAFLRCRQTVACHGWGQSLFYPPGPPPAAVIAQVHWEWYRPTDAERNVLDPQENDHVEKGGLLLRDLTDDGRSALLAQSTGGQEP